LTGVSLLPFGKIELEDGNLIPSNPFEDVTPDKVEYEGYMGNVSICLLTQQSNSFYHIVCRRCNAL
jgi:hypothetical protein